MRDTMNTRRQLTAFLCISFIALTVAPSSALVVVICDRTPVGRPIEDLFRNNFSNVTEIRHGDYSSFSAQASQDALLGTGVFTGRSYDQCIW